MDKKTLHDHIHTILGYHFGFNMQIPTPTEHPYPERAQKLFAQMGIDPHQYDAVLSAIYASPYAVANNLGVECTVRMSVYLSSLLLPTALQEIVNFKPEQYGLGALDPKDMPDEVRRRLDG